MLDLHLTFRTDVMPITIILDKILESLILGPSSREIKGFSLTHFYVKLQLEDYIFELEVLTYVSLIAPS